MNTRRPSATLPATITDPAVRRRGPQGEVCVYIGDAVELLAELPDASIDAIVTDPPYGLNRSTAGPEPGSDGSGGSNMATAPMLGHISANWHERATHSRGYADVDNHAFQAWVTIWALQCRRVLKPGGHLMAFGGTRTWHRLAAGVEDAGFEIRDSLAWLYASGFPKSLDVGRAVRQHRSTAGATDEDRTTPHVPDGSHGSHGPDAEDWAGWGTTLKPAHEPIVLARAPMLGTVAANVTKHRTGALNIAATRRDGDRWPANVYLDHERAQELGRLSRDPASQFFWVAKPSQRERVNISGLTHPTVKPLDLMRQLIRLVTPPGGIVLDPFAGSGTTVEASILEGVCCIGLEREPAYQALIEHRIDRRLSPATVTPHGEQLEQPSLFDVGHDNSDAA